MKKRKVLGCLAGLFAACGSAIHPGIACAADDSSSAASPALEEIVVTAQRREQRLQDVPITVSKFTAQALENANIQSALDLNKIQPSVQLNPAYGAVSTFMRGIGSPIDNIGAEQSVAVYLDGVYQERLSPILLRLNNIDNIEVLEGPQGTLFGRNASGGLINIITADPKPGQEFAGRASLGYANYNTLDESGSIAFGVGQNGALQLSEVYHNQVDGWGHDVLNGAPALTDFDRAVRAKFVYQLDDATRLKATLDWARSNSDQGEGLHYAFGGPAGYPDGSGKLPNVGFYNTQNNLQNTAQTTTYDASFEIERDLPFARLIDTLAYNRTDQSLFLDIDASPQNYINEDPQLSYTHAINDELRLVSNGEGRLKWAAGLYYFEDSAGYNPQGLTGTALGLPPGEHLNEWGHEDVKSYAAYAQSTLGILPKTNLTAGVRYTHDIVSGSGYQSILTPPSIENIIPGTQGSTQNAYSKVTWRFALDHKITDDALVYISASNGFKSGGYNIEPFYSYNKFIEPEVLTAYEIGFKSEWLDQRVRANGAVFYYDYKNPQVFTTPVGATAVIVNAGAAFIDGVEVSLEAVPLKNLTLRFASTSLLAARYTSFDDAPFYFPNPNSPYGLSTPVIGSAAGNQLPRAPKETFSAGGNYTAPLQNGGALNFDVNYYHTSGFFWDADNVNRQDNYGLLDAKVAYTFPSTATTIRLWGSNLTRTKYYISENEVAGSEGALAIPGAPMTFGIAADYRF